MKERDCPRAANTGFHRLSFLFSAALVLFAGNAFAQQFSAYGGIGVEYYKADGLSNYLNYAAPGSAIPGEFSSAVRFMVGGEYELSKDWAVGIEYGYITKSVSGNNFLSSQQVNFSYSLPSLTIRRLIRVQGFVVRLGGAFGYHFGSLSTSSPYSSQSVDYSATGLGVRLDGSFDAQLDKRLYVRVGGEARAEFVGNLKAADGTELTYLDFNSGNMLPVNMHLLGVGVSLGLVYYF